jgi:hypothetical protein
VPKNFGILGSTLLYSQKERAPPYLSTVRHKNQISAEKQLKFMEPMIMYEDLIG